MRLRVLKGRRTPQEAEVGILEQPEIHIDLDFPRLSEEDNINSGRRNFVGAILLTLTSAVAGGFVGADVGARIRRENDRESASRGVERLVAGARQQEQEFARSAMIQAQMLTSALRRARGQTTCAGYVLNGRASWNTREGLMEVAYPVAFANEGDPLQAPRWVATSAIEDDMVTFNLLPLDDDANLALDGPNPLLEVEFYTAGNGSGDVYHATSLWATADGRNPWLEPGVLTFPGNK